MYADLPAPNSGDSYGGGAAPPRPEDPTPSRPTPTAPTATQLLPASLVSRRPGVPKPSNKPVTLAVTSAPVPMTFTPISDGGQVACGLLQSITDLCTCLTRAHARARARARAVTA